MRAIHEERALTDRQGRQPQHTLSVSANLTLGLVQEAGSRNKLP